MGRVQIGTITAPGEVNQADLDAATAMVNAHIIDDTPHPAYDDIQSLTGLFENGIA